jgi:molybdenum cofactor cytidylyltransferase
VIEQVVRSLQASPIDAVLVVVGHRGAEIAGHLSACEIHIVQNPNYAQGMLSSVQAGVAAADLATTLFLIALADQPSIPPELIAHLIEVFDDRRPGMLIPTFEGRRGHPLLIDARYRNEIASLNPEVGLRELLQRHPQDLLLHPVSVEAVIRDLDTREEYEAELARWEREHAMRE